jgi:hypothetical protein
MIRPATSSKTTDSGWGWLRNLGGVVALLTGLLLLIGMISLITTVLQPGPANGWLMLFRNNWLVKIFILHAGIGSIPADLHGLNLLDIVILLLVSMLCLSLSSTFRSAGKVWSLIALALSLIAILLFVTTQVAGRSTVMLTVLINSFVLLRDKAFGKVTSSAGISASLLLFVGDLTVGVHSNAITVLFAVGYLLLTIWFFLVAQALFRLGSMP